MHSPRSALKRTTSGPHLSPTQALALVVGLSLGLGGCLEAREGQRVGDVAADAPDASDTADTSDPCEGVVCDDGDPCTVGTCDPATGTCRYDGLGEPPECSEDGDCDDGDPCTAGECVVHYGECGWAYCEHVPIPGACGGCQVAGCPDEGPCRAGVCQADGSCRYEPVEGCLSGCSSAGALTPLDVMNEALWGEPVKVAGAATGHGQAVCDDGPNCWCESLPVLEGDAAAAWISLRPPEDEPMAWGWGWSYCEGPPGGCEPFHDDVHYWVWGVGEISGRAAASGAGSGANRVRAIVDEVKVEDYCLQTNALGLPGSYRGHIVGDASDLRPAVDATIEATITADAAGAMTITLQALPCEGCDPDPSWFPSHTGELEAGDGWVRFDIPVPGICDVASSEGRARLWSRQNSLEGRYGDAGSAGAPPPGDDADEPMMRCDGLALRLTRVR